MDTIISGLVDREFVPVSQEALQSERLQSNSPMPSDCDGDCGQDDCDCADYDDC
jgi:hypothetical protein